MLGEVLGGPRDAEVMRERLLAGDRAALARAITLAESKRPDHRAAARGLIDAVLPLAPGVVRVWLPPDSNSLLSISEHCFRSRDHVNLIVVDKQPHLQYLSLEEANKQAAAGASIWDWAGTENVEGELPDIVLASAGDVPTQEILAAAQLLREWVPYLRVRVVNVMDLMVLLPQNDHPHGLPEDKFTDLFTRDVDVVPPKPRVY